jgi:hypothetical protein
VVGVDAEDVHRDVGYCHTQSMTAKGFRISG